MTLLSALTFAIAALGAVLGVLNTWNAINDRRVRLKVTPSWSLGPSWSGLSITVVNLSSFPVTLTEVGFTLDRSRSPLPRRLPITLDRTVQGPALPIRLDRRESYSVVFHADDIHARKPVAAYALTGCGTLRRGDSGALRQFREKGLVALS